MMIPCFNTFCGPPKCGIGKKVDYNQPELSRGRTAPMENTVDRITFSASFMPKKAEVDQICQALTGWEETTDVFGISFLPAPEVEEGLKKWLAPDSDAIAPDVGLVSEIAAAKTRAMNVYALLRGDNLHGRDDFTKESFEFLYHLREELVDSLSLFRKMTGFDESAQQAYIAYIAKTAPVLHYMGFEDAIPHAGQVSRLCALIAWRHGASGSEVLQAAMVGWLHDPKLRNDISWSNMATHPVVASVLAGLVFEGESVRAPVAGYLEKADGDVSLDAFVSGLRQALAVNNDSRFVVRNVILHKPAMTVPMDVEPGLADQVDESTGRDQARAVDALFEQRLAAPSIGEKPQKPDEALLALIDRAYLETGMRGISAQAWQRACEAAGMTAGPELFTDVVEGRINNSPVIRTLAKTLADDPEAAVPVRVSGSSLLCHHDEITGSGKQAARALVVADPLMLSPHKIVVASYEETFVERLQAFISSFQQNVQYLPLSDQRDGKLWQRAVLISILKAADSVNANDGNPPSLVKDFLKRHKRSELDEELLDLHRLCVGPDIWGPYAEARQDDAAFAALVESLRKEYAGMLVQYRRAMLANDGSERRIA